MIGKMMTTAAFALTMLGAPALAQTTGSMGGDSGMQSGTTPGGAMGGSMTDGSMAPAHPMTKAQMASMKKCQAMPSAKMMKNKACMKMQSMHPEMTTPAT